MKCDCCNNKLIVMGAGGYNICLGCLPPNHGATKMFVRSIGYFIQAGSWHLLTKTRIWILYGKRPNFKSFQKLPIDKEIYNVEL